MPQTDFFNTNLRRSYPFSQGPTFVDQEAVWNSDTSGTTFVTDAGVKYPFRNAWIVDAGFILSHKAGFDPAINSVHLVQIHFDPAASTDGVIYFEFRADSTNMNAYRFVVAHDLFWAASVTIPETDYITYFVKAIDGAPYQPSLRGGTFVSPLDADVGPTAYNGGAGPYDPTGTESPYHGWGFVTIGRVADWWLNPSASLTIHPLTPHLIEDATIQTIQDAQSIAIHIANEDPVLLPDPCMGGPLIVPVAGSALSVSPALAGDIKLKEGYNTNIQVDEPSNVITINGQPGRGAGTPCDAPPTYTSYGHDPSCRHVIFAINGARPGDDGSFFLGAGTGVHIIEDPTNNTITIEADPESRFICGYT